MRFRSRLETRWATFFTLLGWSWQYEPDLEYNGWIPDFMMTSGVPMLIEVKPERSIAALVENHRERIEKSGAAPPVVLLGAALASSIDEDPPIGARMCLGGKWEPLAWSRFDLLGGGKPRPFKVAQRLWVKASNALQWRRR